MELPEPDTASDDAMDSFLDKFQSQPYRGGFHKDQWEEEFEKIPLFMKKAPSEIDPKKNPDLACLQSIIFDEERSPEEQARTYKGEGNDYFKEKDYKKAVISYTEGLKKKCADPDLNAVLYTNRAAAQYYLGNFRSALNDVTAARKLKPCHLKAIVRGALCHLELRNYVEAVNWCDEGLQIDATEKKLLEMRAKADKLKRTEQRDIRKAKSKEKKEQNQNEAVLQAIKARNIRLVSEAAGEDEDSASEGLSELVLNGLSPENPYGARLSIDDQGRLSWPVLFLYPEYAQSDFISAFHEDSRFIDHLMVMFGETPSWDLEQKYCPDNLEVYFEDEDRAELYQVSPKSTLLQVLQHPRYSVKALTPAFLVCVGSSAFCRNYFRGRKVHQVK
ncbi:tetratricopeptide repeat protein 4 isoform X1 [Hippopotamus amphibius kiboko]|uniref:tetratricopeptide repeat protein 4 isoform X1 n=1 Tax=Hippopotamus amphibius kiboko TaxID=575201 RepID=UPI002599A4EF|nr:tetratricopeptide repeat protein 4 isoform X1 [Hippopotamus amphibius kiboko]